MKISNSQILAAQQCERRFFYEHVLKLRPKEYPEAMERGIDGHSMMEDFFKAMQEGLPYDKCVEAVNNTLTKVINKPNSLQAYRLVMAYCARAFEMPWKIIAVEENRLDPINDEGDLFAYTPDLIVEWTAGPKRGRRMVLDFKFTGQYWTDKEIAVFQQLPKYVIYYNKTADVKISAAGVVMLNTRAAIAATGDKLFMIKYLDLNKKKLATIEHGNLISVARVKNMKENYSEEEYVRTVNTFNCKLCPFGEMLCPMDMSGQDTTRVKEKLFMINTYFDDNYGDVNGQETDRSA